MSVPALRFKDETGQDFANSVDTVNFKKVIESNKYGPRFDAGDYDLNGNVKTIRGTDVSQEGEIKYSQVPTAKLDSSFIQDHILKDGDLVMITTADCGLTGVFRKQDVECIPSAYAVKIELNKLGYPYYFKYYFQTKRIKKEISKYVRKGTVANLPLSDIGKINIKLPNIQEQTKIANFLTAVDEKITHLNQKHDLLTQYKKGVMQQIFSQKLRFKDDDGQDFPEWKEAGFDELFYVANNKKTQIKSSDYLEQGNTPIVDQGQKHIVGYTNNPEIYKDVPVIIFGDHTRILKWIDFVFASGADGTQVLKSTDRLNLKFGYYALCHIELPNLGYSRHMKELKEQFIIIPTSISEQTKIANFLTAIDDKINTAQTQLLVMKQFKQGLLQQMFI